MNESKMWSNNRRGLRARPRTLPVVTQPAERPEGLPAQSPAPDLEGGGEGRGAAVTGEAAADLEAGPGPWVTCSNLRRHVSAFRCGLKDKCPRPQDTRSLPLTLTREAEMAPS